MINTPPKHFVQRAYVIMDGCAYHILIDDLGFVFRTGKQWDGIGGWVNGKYLRDCAFIMVGEPVHKGTFYIDDADWWTAKAWQQPAWSWMYGKNQMDAAVLNV